MYKIIFSLFFSNIVISLSYSATDKLSNISEEIESYCGKGAIEQIYSQDELKEKIQKLELGNLKTLISSSSASMCNSAYSILVRRLSEQSSSEGMKLISSSVDKCRSSLSHKSCDHFKNKSFVYELTTVLSTICNRESFEVFQKLNCLYKETNFKNCSLFQGLSKDINACPNYYFWRKDYRDLFKHYTNPRCQTIKFKKLQC